VAISTLLAIKEIKRMQRVSILICGSSKSKIKKRARSENVTKELGVKRKSLRLR